MSIDDVFAWLSGLAGLATGLASGLPDWLAGAAGDIGSLVPTRLTGALLLPPALPLLVAALGLLAVRRRPSAGRMLAWTGLLAGWLFSCGTGASWLASLAEGDARSGLTAEALRAALAGRDAPQAIVILGGGTRDHPLETPAREFVKPLALERLVHGAWIARTTRLPVLVSGGVPRGGMASEAAVMKRTLEDTFGTPVRWVEEASRDTGENAQRSAAILKAAGISRVVLVTQAYHMPRAAASFRRAGLTVLPAPHGFAGGMQDWTPRDLVPNGEAAALAHRASHELLGRLWYRLRNR
ncbi:YdcF family protein [Zeimonas arvi]|uniref:YdcF family protein n=1 Tax=Zeimonas arvi TaxID=2498847 RepID=A0A5C8NMM3_9BURK|nr:YdcF family protein [Zeimonas arvi]TXL62438.1 YdcF family protein [Zeimonas arvi]